MEGQRPGAAVAEISRAGAAAGYTVSALLVVSGAVVLVAGWDELWRRCVGEGGECQASAAAAGLASMASLAAVGAGGWSVVRLRRRPMDAQGSSGWVVALGAMLALGLLLVAWRLPAFTCDRGRFDEVLELCLHPPSTSEPSRWGWVKIWSALGGLGGWAVMALRPRWVWVMAPLAILAWAAGAGLLLSQTLV